MYFDLRREKFKENEIAFLSSSNELDLPAQVPIFFFVGYWFLPFLFFFQILSSQYFEFKISKH